MKTLEIEELIKAHPLWCARGNAEFFGDLQYKILHNKQGNPYLVRLTNQWSDMFGEKLTQCWRINPIGADLEIKPLIAQRFRTQSDVEEWLKTN